MIEHRGHCGQMDARGFVSAFRKTPENLRYYYSQGLDKCGTCWDLAQFPNPTDFATLYPERRAQAPRGESTPPVQDPGEAAPTSPIVSQTTELPTGMPSEQEAEQDRAYCENSQQSASTCCTDPIKCVSGLNGPSIGTVNTVGALAGGALALRNQGDDQRGIADNCSLMKKVAFGGAAANTALGAKCYSEKTSCEEKCQSVATKYGQVLKDCDLLYDQWKNAGGQGPRCSAEQRRLYLALVANAQGRRDGCTSYNNEVARMGNQAAQSMAASKFAAECESAAMANTENPESPIEPVSFNGDCSDPVNASNPICVRCASAAAQTDPLCRGLNGGRSPAAATGSGFSSASFGARNVDGSDLNVPTVEAQSQDAPFGIYDQQARANSIPGNGGGFVGGSESGGVGFGGGGGLGSTGDGYDTDVLKGVGGRSGFTTASANSAGVENRSGFYGSYQSLKEEKERNGGLDLRKYLPGGTKDPKRRSVAGLQGLAPNELGHSHDDIFQRISNRVRLLCKTDRLMCKE
ncbi:MAG: hypothetical protein H6624_19645 [Bdellovibrionaceae bacterium]|nr:hypothetical protein [Bdellovibrionales bacterium]MCB9086564.1 hypothetical protein [Pseudobdellovibrionaceae bacterium]